MLRYFGLVSLLALSGCGDNKDSDAYSGPGFKSTGSSFAGLMFAVVDKDFTSSQILFNEFSTGDVKTVSSGESGDPFVRWVDGKGYLFNRTETSLNFRTVDPRPATPALGTQTATPGAAFGDPHDAALLGPGRMILAQFSGGKIVVINPETGALVQDVTASWDLGTGVNALLRPNEFLIKERDGGKDVYVMHHGLDANFQPNETQQVFVLRDDGSAVTAVDQDDTKEGVQGIALPFKAPSGFFTIADGSLVTYSECDGYSVEGCKSGFVKIDLAAKKAEVLYDTSTLIGNGGVAKGDGDVFYALVAKGREKTAAKVIARIDLNGKTVTDFYTFKGERGCCSLTYDSSAKTLYSGDVAAYDPNAGVLLAFPDGQTTPTEAALPGNPYGGLLVPK